MYAALSCSPTTVWLLHIQQDNLPGFAGCPPGTEPGGNWVDGCECTRQQPEPTPHLTLCAAFRPADDPNSTHGDWNSTPFLLTHSPLLRCHPLHPLTALRPVMSTSSGSYDPGLDTASRPPPATTPDRSVVAGTVQCKPVGRLAAQSGSRQFFCRKTQLLSCRPIHTHSCASPSFLFSQN